MAMGGVKCGTCANTTCYRPLAQSECRSGGANAQNGAAVAAVADRGRHNAKEGDCTDAVVGLAANLAVRNLVARCPRTGRAR